MKIGLIACQGNLPVAVYDQLKQGGHEIFVITFAEVSCLLQSDCYLSLGKIGQLFRFLKSNAIDQIVFAGAITRPNLWRLRFDLQGIRLALKLIPFLSKGDDTLLGFICDYLADYGFNVASIADLCPKLKMPAGCLTKKQPDQKMQDAITYGQQILRATSEYDIGQSIAVAGQVVVGLEVISGTDIMLQNVGQIDPKRLQSLPKPILVKMPKQHQSNLMDLPTIGIDTIENLAKNGFIGAAFQQGSCLILDIHQLVKLADDLGLFIIGFDDA